MFFWSDFGLDSIFIDSTITEILKCVDAAEGIQIEKSLFGKLLFGAVIFETLGIRLSILIHIRRIFLGLSSKVVLVGLIVIQTLNNRVKLKALIEWVVSNSLILALLSFFQAD